MTRRDIKYSTIGLVLFSSVLAVVLLVVPYFRLKREAGKQEGMAEAGVHWLDTLSNAASSQSSMKGVDADIERYMYRRSLQGVSFAVSRNDSLLYVKGYGWADKEKGEKMTPGHIMRIASASKLVTAIAVMKLAEQGKLKLTDRVFGPGGILDREDFNSEIRDKRIYDITVYDLLLHRGGFGRNLGDPLFTTRDIIAQNKLSTPPDADELTRIVLRRRLSYTPRSGRRYSNYGYLVLSMIVEKASGMEYEKYVAENMLGQIGPRGMRMATNYYEQKYPEEVRYYTETRDLVEEFTGSGRMVPPIYGGSDYHALSGAGGWCTSAAALSLMVAMVDKHPGIPDILRPSTIDLMTSYSEKEKLAAGWSSTDEHGRWERTGTLASTHTLIERFPDGDCWIIITNTGSLVGSRISHELSRLVENMRARYSDSLPRQNLFEHRDVIRQAK